MSTATRKSMAWRMNTYTCQNQGAYLTPAQERRLKKKLPRSDPRG